MFREGLPSSVLIIGFSFSVLVVATLLLEPNTLALILTGIALLAIYIVRKQIRRTKAVLFLIVSIWFVCVGIQRFVVPFVFDHVFQPYQVQRIYSLIGKDYIPKDRATEAALEYEQKTSAKQKSANNNNYNVKQSKIAIGSGGLIGKGLLKGTQTRYDFVPEQRTDFIFCTIGEGFGFSGILFLGIYMFLLMPGSSRWRAATKRFQPMLCLRRRQRLFLSYRHQCLYDHRAGPGDRHTAALCQLWRHLPDDL